MRLPRTEAIHSISIVLLPGAVPSFRSSGPEIDRFEAGSDILERIWALPICGYRCRRQRCIPFGHRSLTFQQGGRERAGYGLLSLTCPGRIADSKHLLAGAHEPTDLLRSSPTGSIVKPVPKPRPREDPTQPWPATESLVEHKECGSAQSKTIAGTSRDNDMIENSDEGWSL